MLYTHTCWNILTTEGTQQPTTHQLQQQTNQPQQTGSSKNSSTTAVCSPVADHELSVRYGDPVVMTTDDAHHPRI